MLRAGAAGGAVQAAAPAPVSRWRLFANIWLVTALNPKGIVFFVAFLPQFIEPARDTSGQLWILALTFVTLAAVNASLYAVFASVASRWLATPRAQKGFHLLGGSILSGAGLWALLARRP